MSASPEFFKPSAQAGEPLLPPMLGNDYDDYDYRTPTGSGISYLKEPTTCPPAPKKPPPPLKPPCRKRLFQPQRQAQGDQRQPAESSSVPLISLRLDELERLYRPHPPPANTDKRRRSVSASADKHPRSLN